MKSQSTKLGKFSTKLGNLEMTLDKLTLLRKDNQFGRKYPFKFDRVAATESETGPSIVLASSDKW